MKALAALVLVIVSGLSAGVAVAQDHSGHDSPYAGFEDRDIKSLSPDDLEELRRGGGWGLALAAELNGVPGPAHLLELKDEIPLTTDQVEAIESIHRQMRTEAIAAGERLIAAERAIEAVFREGRPEAARLKALIDDAAAARADLRFIHLSRHLSTPDLLSGEQIERYNVLRGYGDDPCADVPAGHDPEMWRRHNGCD